MRYLTIIFLTAILISSCKKDKFTTVPQLTYKSIEPSSFKAGTTTTGGALPKLILEVTDEEGDLGLIPFEDSSHIYIKNLKTNFEDSVIFPNIRPIVFKKFTATIEVSLEKFLQIPNPSVKDTLFYEVYIKDFAKNKSNVVKCGPLYYIP